MIHLRQGQLSAVVAAAVGQTGFSGCLSCLDVAKRASGWLSSWCSTSSKRSTGKVETPLDAGEPNSCFEHIGHSQQQDQIQLAGPELLSGAAARVAASATRKQQLQRGSFSGVSAQLNPQHWSHLDQRSTQGCCYSTLPPKDGTDIANSSSSSNSNAYDEQAADPSQNLTEDTRAADAQARALNRAICASPDLPTFQQLLVQHQDALNPKHIAAAFTKMQSLVYRARADAADDIAVDAS